MQLRMISWIPLLFLALFPLKGQAPQPVNGAQLMLELEKLKTLGSVLYIAAHPDDENTRLITYLANEKKMRTAYLSLTRGDGGQNLIGTEKGPLLGMVRTQELLQARRIDGGIQFFTRAVDFGYSKTAEETMDIWDREKVLADMVWVIRKFRPDVIITRFPPPEYEYGTHGHHQASAILAEEAFEAAADPSRFPEQLHFVETWQPTRLYWNTSTWFYRRSGEAFDSTGKIMLDVGEYSPLLGASYSEIASESRSQHKSQGFGAGKTRGSQPEWLEYVMGDRADGDLFEGINTDWDRVPGGKPVGELLEKAALGYKQYIHRPDIIVPYLVAAYGILDEMEPGYWVNVKKEQLSNAIALASGLYFEAIAEENTATPGATLPLEINVVRRLNLPVRLKTVEMPFAGKNVEPDEWLPFNELKTYEESLFVPGYVRVSHPYWLRDPLDGIGMYHVEDQVLIGKPENEPAAKVGFIFNIEGVDIHFTRRVMYKYTDRVKGEVYRNFQVAPDVTVNIQDKVYVFAGKEPKPVSLTLRAWKENQEGEVSLPLPDGWRSEPAGYAFHLKEKGEEQVVEFLIHPPDEASELELHPVVITKTDTFENSYILIDYDHIPTQMLFPQAGAHLVKLDIQKEGEEIGYIMGAGDEIPQSLRQIGYKVTLIDEENFEKLDLEDFDAILIGIRAYNTHQWLVQKKPALTDYVEEGGVVITQYQTTWGLITNDFAPYEFEIGRGRVTDERARVSFIDPKAGILHHPNELTLADFQGWVQERGLYFAKSWDPAFRPVFSMHDPGEDPEEGSLLIAEYGDGAFIYTGISFFRQLPAGVPGAYRLIANLISYGE